MSIRSVIQKGLFAALLTTALAACSTRELHVGDPHFKTDFVPGSIYVLTRPAVLHKIPFDNRLHGVKYAMGEANDAFLKEYREAPSRYASTIECLLERGTQIRCDRFFYIDFYAGSETLVMGTFANGPYAGQQTQMLAIGSDSYNVWVDVRYLKPDTRPDDK